MTQDSVRKASHACARVRPATMGTWSTELPEALRAIFPTSPLSDMTATYEYKILFAPEFTPVLRCTVLMRLAGTEDRRPLVNRRGVLDDICARSGQRMIIANDAERTVRFQGDAPFILQSTRFRCVSRDCESTVMVRSWVPIPASAGLLSKKQQRACVQCGRGGHQQATCCEAPGTCRVELVWRHEHEKCADKKRGRMLMSDVKYDGGFVGKAIAGKLGMINAKVEEKKTVSCCKCVHNDCDATFDPIETVLPSDDIVNQIFRLMGWEPVDSI